MTADVATIRSALVDALARIPTAGDGSVVGSTDTGIASGEGNLQLGRTGDGELVAFVAAPADTKCPQSKTGLSVAVRELRTERDGPVSTYLVMTCRRSHLEETFLDLMAIVGSSIVDYPDDPIGAMVRHYVRWRELFSDLTRRELSAPGEAGLTAEMVVLGDIVGVEGPGAVDWWLGPSGARHDFTDGFHALEVKAVIGAGIDRVGIHGIEQLEEPPGGTLHLAVYRLEEGTGEVSVTTQFTDLVNMGVDPLKLREKLMELGVDPTADQTRRKWRVVEQRLYRVDDSFPRMVPSTFPTGAPPSGVSNIQYFVSLGGCDVVASATVARLWAEMNGGRRVD